MTKTSNSLSMTILFSINRFVTSTNMYQQSINQSFGGESQYVKTKSMTLARHNARA